MEIMEILRIISLTQRDDEYVQSFMLYNNPLGENSLFCEN